MIKTKEEIIEPFIWKDNTGNPRIAIMDCLNAMEIYADQFKASGGWYAGHAHGYQPSNTVDKSNPPKQ